MGHGALKVPTGVADFDAIVKGGLPAGSLVMLRGAVGAGMHEFVYTSAYTISMVKENPYTMDHMMSSLCTFEGLPDKMVYITFSRSKADILREIADGFDISFYNLLSRKMHFIDLSANYYKKTLVPPSWTGEDNGGKLFGGTPQEGVLEALIKYLDEIPRNSMIIIDSLTDLAISDNIKMTDLVNVLKGIQRVSKRWGGIIYLMLTEGILDKRDEKIITDSVDGVLVFEWNPYCNSSKRQRYIYVEKFMTVLPHLDNERLSRFPTLITSHSGMQVINMEMIA
jgi:KaiC/GvpD/RAD55 family RecA-like ATPase